MTILKKIREKMGIDKTAESGSVTGYKGEDVEREELSPLDIIKQDTDIFSEEAEYMFRLPTPSLEISDYFAHFLIPAEDMKRQSVRTIQ